MHGTKPPEQQDLNLLSLSGTANHQGGAMLAPSPDTRNEQGGAETGCSEKTRADFTVNVKHSGNNTAPLRLGEGRKTVVPVHPDGFGNLQ